MAFLNKIKGAPVPPLKSFLNVAEQTARQFMPDKKSHEQTASSAAGHMDLQQHQQQLNDPANAMITGEETNYGTGKTLEFLYLLK